MKILAASTCMIDFFCKSMAASNFCDDGKSALRTPFGHTQSFEMSNLVKQGTVLGPIFLNCSLDDICSEGHGHIMSTIEVRENK